MNKENNIVTATQFLELLKKGGDDLSRFLAHPKIVKDFVKIDGKELGLNEADQQARQSLGLQNLTFLGHVSIGHCNIPLIRAENSNFLSGFAINDCTGKTFYIRNCQLRNLHGYHNQFERLELHRIHGEAADRPEWTKHPIIDISGFTLTDRLALSAVKAEELVTISDHVPGSFSAPAAIVDDMLWAVQLRFLGIPIHVCTELARLMLEKGNAESLARAIA